MLQDAPWPTLVERARRVEAMGFDTLWVADHFVNPYAPRTPWYDGWTLLAALAAVTERIRIGPLVTSNTLRNPALLARMAMTVDHVSGGRLELGIGAGGAPLDYSMLGLPAWSPRERVDRLDEALKIVIPLLESGEVRNVHGALDIEEAVISPLSIQRPRPPITVGALGPRAIEVAARHGNAWNGYGVGEGRAVTGRLGHDDAVEATRRRIDVLHAACDRHGRDRASVRKSYLSFRGYIEPLGTPTDFARMFADFQRIGVSELSVYWPRNLDEEPALEALAREAIPDLRR